MNYSGWANYETWNIALWINNTENLYRLAVEFMRQYRGRRFYCDFIEWAGLKGKKTPDGVSFSSRKLNLKELNDNMREIRG